MATNMVKLVWDDAIAATAKTWADNCEFAHDSSGYGENLYVAFSSADNIDHIGKLLSGVDDWYEEFADYTYDGNMCAGVCGHYTQNVWANTKKVGCGYQANCGMIDGYHDVFLVCRYDPPGNYVGQLPYEEATTSDEIASNCPTGYVPEDGLCIESSNATPAPTAAPTRYPCATLKKRRKCNKLGGGACNWSNGNCVHATSNEETL